jgi:hypothetical protein
MKMRWDKDERKKEKDENKRAIEIIREQDERGWLPL